MDKVGGDHFNHKGKRLQKKAIAQIQLSGFYKIKKGCLKAGDGLFLFVYLMEKVFVKQFSKPSFYF